MKATIDVPDELYRRVKARSALEGRTVREVTTELYRRWLGDEPVSVEPEAEEPESAAEGAGKEDAGEAWLEAWDELGRRIQDAAHSPHASLQILLEDRRSRAE